MQNYQNNQRLAAAKPTPKPTIKPRTQQTIKTTKKPTVKPTTKPKWAPKPTQVSLSTQATRHAIAKNWAPKPNQKPRLSKLELSVIGLIIC